MIESGLLSLLDAHFQVNGISVDIDFYGVKVVEYVSIIIIEVADGIIVGRKAFI